MPLPPRLRRAHREANKGEDEVVMQKRMDEDFWLNGNKTKIMGSRESKSLFDKRNFHLVKRSHDHRTKDLPHHNPEANDDMEFDRFQNPEIEKRSQYSKVGKNAPGAPSPRIKRGGGKKTLETAVFLDA